MAMDSFGGVKPAQNEKQKNIWNQQMQNQQHKIINQKTWKPLFKMQLIS